MWFGVTVKMMQMASKIFFIAQLKNSWTIEGKRTLVSAPIYPREQNGDLNNPNDVKHLKMNEVLEILKQG